MVAALSIVPVTGGDAAGVTAEVRRVVEAARLPCRFTATGVCVVASWSELFALAKTCHETARLGSSRVVTLIGIEDGDEDPKALFESATLSAAAGEANA